MAVGNVLREVCAAVGLSTPTAFFSAASSTIRKWQQLQLLTNEAARMIAGGFDWQGLRKVAQLAGDGSAEGFALPADFGRMLKSANVWSSRYRRDMTHIVDSDDWLSFEFITLAPHHGAWTLYSGQMHVQPVMASGDKVKFFYVSNQIARAGDGTLKAAFTADEDSFLVDERLLRLAIVYLWKQMQGQDFAAELADYEIAFDQATSGDGGSKPVLSGDAPRRGRTAWPGTVAG
nr:MAG TPA: head to tail adaptor [Caudoviricetes sp.]DAK00509.1 MAG TPA: head to tail adaptor [Caudoviricetes sp.]